MHSPFNANTVLYEVIPNKATPPPTTCSMNSHEYAGAGENRNIVLAVIFLPVNKTTVFQLSQAVAG